MESLLRFYFLDEDALELVKITSLFAERAAGIAQKLPGKSKTHSRSRLNIEATRQVYNGPRVVKFI